MARRTPRKEDKEADDVAGERTRLERNPRSRARRTPRARLGGEEGIGGVGGERRRFRRLGLRRNDACRGGALARRRRRGEDAERHDVFGTKNEDGLERVDGRERPGNASLRAKRGVRAKAVPDAPRRRLTLLLSDRPRLSRRPSRIARRRGEDVVREVVPPQRVCLRDAGRSSAPCARMSKVTTRDCALRAPAPARSASTSGANTRPWNSLARAHRRRRPPAPEALRRGEDGAIPHAAALRSTEHHPVVDGTLGRCMAVVAATLGRGGRARRCAASDEVRRCSKRQEEKTKTCPSCADEIEGMFSAIKRYLDDHSAHAPWRYRRKRAVCWKLSARTFRRISARPHRRVRGEGEIRKHGSASPRSPTAVLGSTRRDRLGRACRGRPCRLPRESTNRRRDEDALETDQGGRRGVALHAACTRAGGGQRARQLRDAHRGRSTWTASTIAHRWRTRRLDRADEFINTSRGRPSIPRVPRFLLKTRRASLPTEACRRRADVLHVAANAIPCAAAPNDTVSPRRVRATAPTTGVALRLP